MIFIVYLLPTYRPYFWAQCTRETIFSVGWPKYQCTRNECKFPKTRRLIFHIGDPIIECLHCHGKSTKNVWRMFASLAGHTLSQERVWYFTMQRFVPDPTTFVGCFPPNVYAVCVLCDRVYTLQPLSARTISCTVTYQTLSWECESLVSETTCLPHKITSGHYNSHEVLLLKKTITRTATVPRTTLDIAGSVQKRYCTGTYPGIFYTLHQLCTLHSILAPGGITGWIPRMQP